MQQLATFMLGIEGPPYVTLISIIQLIHTSNILLGDVISTVIVIFYTEILTRKVVLWCFFSSETSEKIHNSTFQVKISV